MEEVKEDDNKAGFERFSPYYLVRYVIFVGWKMGPKRSRHTATKSPMGFASKSPKKQKQKTVIGDSNPIFQEMINQQLETLLPEIVNHASTQIYIHNHVHWCNHKDGDECRQTTTASECRRRLALDSGGNFPAAQADLKEKKSCNNIFFRPINRQFFELLDRIFNPINRRSGAKWNNDWERRLWVSVRDLRRSRSESYRDPLSQEFQPSFEHLIGFLPAQRQISMFSATFLVTVKDFKDRYLKMPYVVTLI
ncbi:hypothetical protein CTI12_AA490200 [Artemisia annua]|uniref:Uncharacterized protein n=1 Tax=Artemisia annua TaxID=35608 RepID=A0A2U1LH08_ARTAN|nr:hypothetical protein CTI12_AA490200 [Artemisia annua]